MKFSELSFTTKFKLVGGNILLFGGMFMLLTQGLQGVVMIVAGNLLHLDGRISRLEEINESNGKQANQDS